MRSSRSLSKEQQERKSKFPTLANTLDYIVLRQGSNLAWVLFKLIIKNKIISSFPDNKSHTIVFVSEL